jgi:hypothetical protein
MLLVFAFSQMFAVVCGGVISLAVCGAGAGRGKLLQHVLSGGMFMHALLGGWAMGIFFSGDEKRIACYKCCVLDWHRMYCYCTVVYSL